MKPEKPTRLLPLRDLAANADPERLREMAWFAALHLAELEPADRSSFLGALLERAVALGGGTWEWTAGHLLQHVEEMDEALQRRFSELLATGTESGHAYIAAGPSRQRLWKGFRGASEGVAPRAAPRPNAGPDAGGTRRVALVVPEYLSAGTFLQPPLGMLLAAARLRRAGFDVLLIDNRVESLSFEALAARVAAADIVVVTTTPYDHIQNYFLDYRLRHAFSTVNALKRGCPHATVVVCGAHGTVRPDIVLRECAADVVLKGEFDLGLTPVAEVLAAGRPLNGRPDACTRGWPAGEVNELGAIPPYSMKDLRARIGGPAATRDEIRPAYDLIDFDDYYGDVYVENRPLRRPRWATALATRGCAYDCPYCYNFWDRRTQYREPGAVAEELVWLDRAHGVRHLFFLDFHFTQNRDWVSRFAAEARRSGARTEWSAQARCDAAPPELLAEMAAAGCRHLWFGVESYDPDLLHSIGKYGDPGISLKAVADCRAAGIEAHQFIMVGLPGETRRTINATIAHMHAAKAPYCGVMIATPRFGTKYYGAAKRQYPQLGNDFYSLRSVRGLVGNSLRPADLHQAMSIFEDRGFIYQSAPPRLGAETSFGTERGKHDLVHHH